MMTLLGGKTRAVYRRFGEAAIYSRLVGLTEAVKTLIFGRLWRLRRSVELVWHASPRLTIAHAALMFALGILPVASLFLLKLIIDALTNQTAMEPNWALVAALLAAATVVAVLTDWLRALAMYVSDTQSRRVTDYVHELLNRQSINLNLSYYENPEFHDSYHRAQSEAPQRPALIVNRLIGVVQNAISLAGIVFLLVALQWQLTMWVFVAMLPILAVRLRNADLRHRSWRDQVARIRQSHYLSYLINHQDHAKELRLFDLGDYLHGRFSQLQNSIRRDQRAIVHSNTLGEGLTQSCASLAIFGALAFLAHEIAINAINIGVLIIYYQALQRGQVMLRDLFACAADLVENSLFLSNFYDFLSLEPTVREPKAPRPINYPLQSGIRFEDVEFDYPHGGRSVLSGFNLTIGAGERVAIVGRNGAGKTTLVKLLCRLHDPTRGRVTIDGVDLRDVSGDMWRKQIAAVCQDFVRYQFTVRENIGMGDLSALDAPGQIESAAALSGAADAIANLSLGYDTPLGTLFVGGEDLSVGQWQQIAVARAMLRSASVLIFDEPTSALDPKAEAELLKRLWQMAEGRTTIVISHRLSTVCLADRIVVIEGGGIRESGTHQELMQMGGIYAGMFCAQLNPFQSV